MKGEKDKGTSNQIKKIASTLEGNRKSVENQQDVAQSIKETKEVFNEFQSVIKNQSSNITTIKSFEKNFQEKSSKNLEAKRFFNAVCSKLKTDISKFLEIALENFIITAKLNKEEEKKKIEKEVGKILTSLQEQSNTTEKMYSAIVKLLNFKEDLMVDFMRNILYKKNVLWRDLNTRYEEYIHGEVKNSLNLIKVYEEKFGYIPHSLEFKIPKINEEMEESTLPDVMRLALDDINQMIKSIKNYSKLSGDEQLLEDINQNKNVVRGLRQKIEVLTKNYNYLLEKYRKLQIEKGKVNLGAQEQKSLIQKLQDKELLLNQKDTQILQYKTQIQKTDALYHALKEKNKQLEEEIGKWQNIQIPRIKGLEAEQKNLLDEFNKVRKDVQIYSGLYQTERQQKLQAYDDVNAEKKRLSEVVNILGRERRKIKELKADIQRQDQIIMELVEKAPEP